MLLCSWTKDFFRSTEITEFQASSNEFIEIIDRLASDVEKEKMKTIGSRNLLRSVAKERDAQKQQIQVSLIDTRREEFKWNSRVHLCYQRVWNLQTNKHFRHRLLRNRWSSRDFVYNTIPSTRSKWNSWKLSNSWPWINRRISYRYRAKKEYNTGYRNI